MDDNPLTVERLVQEKRLKGRLMVVVNGPMVVRGILIKPVCDTPNKVCRFPFRKKVDFHDVNQKIWRRKFLELEPVAFLHQLVERRPGGRYVFMQPYHGTCHVLPRRVRGITPELLVDILVH